MATTVIEFSEGDLEGTCKKLRRSSTMDNPEMYCDGGVAQFSIYLPASSRDERLSGGPVN